MQILHSANYFAFSAFHEVRSEPLRRAAVLPSILVIPTALFFYKPVFVLLPVGHGGAFEGLGLIQLRLSNDSSAQVDAAQDGIAQVGPAQVGPP